MIVFSVFFCKQKTAYEMRISDWSSDVCSSDLRAAMTEKRGPENTAGLTVIPMDEGMTIENEELRKREAPFAGRLTAETAAKAERATYYGAYKGVTDVLTKYLWPELALVLTRLAARIGMTPNLRSDEHMSE